MLPLVAIILPIRNEAASIKTCLDAIIMQNYPQNLMNTLIIDGLSSDNSRELIKIFLRDHPKFRYKIFDNPRKIVPTGMNIALRHALGEIIIRVDGHTIIAPDYIRQCVEALQSSGADNVGGKMNAVGMNAFGRAVAIATSSPFGVGGARFHFSEKEEWVDTVYMGAWPRRVFEKIGLFDEELVRDQDDEFNYRLREAGGKILLSPKIKSEYTVRGTPKSLWKQYFQYGYWKVRVLQKHPRQMSLWQFVPPIFVFVLFLFPFLAIYPRLRIFAFLTPIAYLVANLSASIYGASRHGWRHLFLLLLVYAILHLSYGLGFLVGLVRFWNRWGDKIGKVPRMEMKSVG